LLTIGFIHNYAEQDAISIFLILVGHEIFSY